jgi:uncharacterized glyoxalase superfamily protein PhnB
MLLITDDPDAAFERAVAAGATVVSPVDDQHGWRLGRVVDPFGHHWKLASHRQKNVVDAKPPVSNCWERYSTRMT